MTGDVLHVRLFPEGELIVGLQVLQWNWMSPHYHRQAELFFDKSLELLDIRARRITDYQTGRQVHDVRSILEEFSRHVFHVASRAAATTGIADELQLVFGGITRKGSVVGMGNFRVTFVPRFRARLDTGLSRDRAFPRN